MTLPADALRDDLTDSAKEFSKSLQTLSVVLDAEISAVTRLGVLMVFSEIIKRSPVDTGAYRASHGIANAYASETEGIVKGVKGQTISPSVAIEKMKSWTWRVGDGDIILYNNLPYAERIENGWSNPGNKPRINKSGRDTQSAVKAPQGVYRVSLAAMTQFINQELAKSKILEPTGEE